MIFFGKEQVGIKTGITYYSKGKFQHGHSRAKVNPRPWDSI
jgi:hypothetical protein